MTEESLVRGPSDLRFWRPTEIGFLAKEAKVNFTMRKSPDPTQYVVVDEFKTTKDVTGALEKLAAAAVNDEHVLSYWVLRRDAGLDESIQDGNALSREFYVFSRFRDRLSGAKFHQKTRPVWEQVKGGSEECRRTTWVEAGIGFLGR